MENKPQSATDSNSKSQDLPRVLGLWDIVGIVVGGIIGSGIFIVPAAIAAEKSTVLIGISGAPWVEIKNACKDTIARKIVRILEKM